MKARDVKVGGRYRVRYNSRLVTVKVVHAQSGADSWHKAGPLWVCRNEGTGRTFKVKSAKRFEEVGHA